MVTVFGYRYRSDCLVNQQCNDHTLLNLMKETIVTEYALGQVVKHKYLDFRGVIYDVDPEFNNTEEWYQSIPSAIRPKKDQPFYFYYMIK